MSGLLSGLSSLGLGDLENATIFEDPKADKAKDEEKKDAATAQEKDLIYDRSFECPVCGDKFTSKIMKTGKAKLLHMDLDLRAVYEGVDLQKYDAITCPKCGFSALSRYFKPMTEAQIKLIKEKISRNVHLPKHNENSEVYTYEEAMERYKLSLACAVVKQGKASEKAYICLKSAWLLRGWQEELSKDPANQAKVDELKKGEKEYLENALDGFLAAQSSEVYPMCGMDETTMDYLLAVLAMQMKRLEVSSKLIASILTSPSANARMKDKARDLKDMVLAEIKKNKE